MNKHLTALVWVALLTPIANADTLPGRVVRIIDGDTVVLLTEDQEQERIRLAGIDCPERGQPFGQRAKQALADRVGNRAVVIDWNKRDRYGRIVGRVLVEGNDADLELVAGGLCWWYRRYAGEQSPADRAAYEAAEDAAKAARLGLWADANPVPPWEWRRR